MADDLLRVLTRFHRQVIAPDLDRRDERLGAVDQKLDEVLTHFDAINHRFDRLESEYQALAAAVGGLGGKWKRCPKSMFGGRSMRSKLASPSFKSESSS